MTVRASQDQEPKSGLDKLAKEKKKKKAVKDCTETESGESEEEMESPKSVQWRMKKKKVDVHSQVLKIREEDSHIGQDIGEGLSAVKDKVNNGGCGGGGGGGGGGYRHHVDVDVDVVFLSRPILPCSPLSGKNATTSIKGLH